MGDDGRATTGNDGRRRATTGDNRRRRGRQRKRRRPKGKIKCKIYISPRRRRELFLPISGKEIYCHRGKRTAPRLEFTDSLYEKSDFMMKTTTTTARTTATTATTTSASVRKKPVRITTNKIHCEGIVLTYSGRILRKKYRFCNSRSCWRKKGQF